MPATDRVALGERPDTGRAATAHADAPPPLSTRLDRSARAGWLAIAAVVLWPVVEALRIIGQPSHEAVFGDYALFELAARRALGLHQLLGPSAHVGLNHPGPAMFYLLAPAVGLLQPGPGLYLGALLINGGALVTTVVFVGRRAGVRAALWTAVAMNLFCLAVSPDTLRQPWNSLLVIVPMTLFVILCAGAMVGSKGAWLWAAVVGSYELQSHITTALFILVAVLLAAVVLAGRRLAGWARRSGQLPYRWWRPARVTGLFALALIWLPSAVELFADQPNNFNRTWRWVHHGHGSGIAVSSSLGIVLRSIAILPFNHRSWGAPLPPSTTQLAVGWLIVAAGGLLIVWLARQGQRFALALAGVAVLAVPMATITVSHAGTDNFAFLTGWLAIVPYTLLVAWGAGLLARRPRPGRTAWWTPDLARKVTAVVAVAAVGCALVTAIVDLRQQSIASIDRQALRAAPFAQDAEAQLRSGDRSVAFGLLSADSWPVVANVVLELERVGYRTVVDPRFDYLFGKERAVLRPSQLLLCFYLANDAAGSGKAVGQVVSTAGGVVMTAWRPPP